MEVKNYILGDWVRGEGNEVTFHHAINGEEIGEFTQLIPTKVYTSLDKFATAKWLVDHADGIP